MTAESNLGLGAFVVFARWTLIGRPSDDCVFGFSVDGGAMKRNVKGDSGDVGRTDSTSTSSIENERTAATGNPFVQTDSFVDSWLSDCNGESSPSAFGELQGVSESAFEAPNQTALADVRFVP
jgi:hypothetical protein